jgi:uncharacterized protein YqgQ
MMLEDDGHRVLYAQNYVTGLLEAEASNESIDPIWGSKSLDLEPSEYGLIVSQGKKRISFTFTKAELTAGYGTGIWAKRLQVKADTILKSINRKK